MAQATVLLLHPYLQFGTINITATCFPIRNFYAIQYIHLVTRSEQNELAYLIRLDLCDT